MAFNANLLGLHSEYVSPLKVLHEKHIEEEDQARRG